MRGRWGIMGKHLELGDLYEAFQEDPAVLEALRENDDGYLEEGTGAPEGRADFPYFLQTVIRHRVRERFDTVASKWRSYMGIESAQDFREHTSSQINGILGIEEVNEYGEYPRLRSSEEPGPSFAVAKHGGIYGVTFEMVINDEVDRILNRIPRELGRMTAEYVSRVVVALIESNPNYIDGQPFFSAAHGNEVTGAAAQPNEDNLVDILEGMKLRRTADGLPYSVTPRKILVRGDRQKLIFNRIIGSQFTGAAVNYTGAAGAGGQIFDKGTINPLYGILPADAVTDEVWLNDADDWYILGDAQDRPPFIAAFLRGRQEPFIGVQDSGVRDVNGQAKDLYTLDFDIIPYKVRHIFGVSIGEPIAATRARPS
jgi:hypothetical protein